MGTWLLLILNVLIFAAFFAAQVAGIVGLVWVWQTHISPRITRSGHTAWLTRDYAKNVAAVLAAAEAPFVAQSLFGWWMAIVVFGLCGAALLLYATCYRDWLPRTGPMHAYTGAVTSAQVLVGALAIALFGLIGFAFGDSIWMAMPTLSPTQKLILGAVVLGLLYWAVHRGAWWNNPAGHWAFRGVLVVYILYATCLLFGLDVPSIDDTWKALKNYWATLDNQDLLVAAAVLVLLVALAYGFWYYTWRTLLLASVAAAAFLVWHSGIISMPQFNSSATVASNAVVVQKNDQAPYVQPWKTRYPRFTADYASLSETEQEAQRLAQWGLITFHDGSTQRTTELIELPGSSYEEQTWFEARLHDEDNVPARATVHCFYGNGQSVKSFKLNREPSCSAKGMVGFKVTSELTGKHNLRFAFRWNGPRPEPKVS